MLLCTSQGYAQEPAVRLAADSTYIGLGDPLTLTLSVKHKEGAEVTFPPFLDTLGGFEVLDVTPINLNQSTADWVRSQQITVIRFDTGSFKIPSQKLMYQASGTAEPTQIVSNPLIIDVIGIEVDTTQTYRPIKGIASVSYSWGEIWPWLIISTRRWRWFCATLVWNGIQSLNSLSYLRRYFPRSSISPTCLEHLGTR